MRARRGRPIRISATARNKGDITKKARFQVCLPTPMGVIYAFCTARDVGAIEAAYEAAFIREVREICRTIPHHDLCIQWDFCHEMVIWDGQPQDMFPVVAASQSEIVDRIVRICAPIPEGCRTRLPSLLRRFRSASLC